MKIDIQSVHFTADQKLIDFIEIRINKLAKLYDRIIDVGVILKLENNGQVRDKVTEIVLNIPGNNLVSKDISKSFEQATDEAVSQLERQIKKLKGKQLDRNRSARSI